MKIDVDIHTRSRKHKQAILALPTTKERLKYVIDHAGKPMAQPTLDFTTWEEFYYPKLGCFIIRSHSGTRYLFRTVRGAKSCAEGLKDELVSLYNELPEQEEEK